jgi:methyl-accepting chemotaxis protein
MKSKSSTFASTISFKLLLSITVTIILMSSVIGTLSYSLAKKELVNSGKLDLQHIVKGVIPTLDQLNKQVHKRWLVFKSLDQFLDKEKVGAMTSLNHLSYTKHKDTFLPMIKKEE